MATIGMVIIGDDLEFFQNVSLEKGEKIG